MDSSSPQDDGRRRAASTDRQTLRTLLDRARLELQKSNHDVVSEARARARLAAIPYDQIPVALELIAGMPGGHDGEAALTDALLTHWAAHDGKAACDFSLAHRTPLTQGIAPIRFPLTAWAEGHPEAALAWYQARAAEKHPALQEEDIGPYQLISNIRWIMTAWIHNDLDAAIAAYRTLTNEKQRTGARIAFSEYAGSVAGRTRLLELFAEAPPSGRDVDLSSALSRWSRERPEELARWLDETTVEGVNPRMLRSAIFKNWAVLDEDAAVGWWMTSDEQDRPTRLRDLMQAWGSNDALAAGRWLAGQELDESFDQAINAYSFQVARTDPARAWEWAHKVHDEDRRTQALRGVVRQWKFKDPAEATRAIEQADLPAAQKAKLLESLQPDKTS